MMHSAVKIFDSIDRRLAMVLKPFVVLLGLFCAFAMVCGIAARELFSTPLLGLEELILFAVMWLYMLGAALASRERSHLSGDFVQVVSNNPRTLARFKLLATVISLALAVIIAVWSFSLFSWGFTHQQSTAVFRIPLYAAQSSLFICSLLFIFYGVRDLLNDIGNLQRTNHLSSSSDDDTQTAYMKSESF